MRQKNLDFNEKVAAFYTREYDAVFVEDLNVKSMLEGDRNGRNTHEVGWHDFIIILNRHGEKRGCHVVEVDPKDTTKAGNQYSVKTEKPLRVREHSCPSCGFETDRDYNAALNVWERRRRTPGVVHSKETPALASCPSLNDA